jgi:hypothetical protein
LRRRAALYDPVKLKGLAAKALRRSCA